MFGDNAKYRYCSNNQGLNPIFIIWLYGNIQYGVEDRGEEAVVGL